MTSKTFHIISGAILASIVWPTLGHFVSLMPLLGMTALVLFGYCWGIISQNLAAKLQHARDKKMVLLDELESLND